MNIFKFLKRDIRLGIVRRSYLFIIAIIFSYIIVRQCTSVMDAIKDLNYMSSNGTVMDYCIFSMQGMKYYRFDPKQSFQIPLLWFVFQIGISYFTAYYTEKDYTNNGANVMVAGKNRSSWWFSKAIWCVLSVLIYYFVTFFTCSLFSMAQGAKLSFNVSYDFYKAYFGYNVTYISYSDLIIVSIITPMLITVGICLVQQLLSLVLSPVTSFALTSMLYVLSAYYTVWFLPGSFTMWLRSSYYDEKGLNPLSGVLISTMLIVLVLVLGKAHIKSKDII